MYQYIFTLWTMSVAPSIAVQRATRAGYKCSLSYVTAMYEFHSAMHDEHSDLVPSLTPTERRAS